MSGDLLSYMWMAVCSRTGSRADCRTGRCCSLLSVCSRRGAGGSREGEFGKILSGAWGWKRGWDPLPSVVNSHVWDAHTHSELWQGHGDEKRGRGWLAAGLLPLWRGEWEGARRDFGAAREWVLLKALKGPEGVGWGEKGPMPWPHQPAVAPSGVLEGKGRGGGRRRLLGLPSGPPVDIFMKCLKGKSNFIMA